MRCDSCDALSPATLVTTGLGFCTVLVDGKGAHIEGIGDGPVFKDARESLLIIAISPASNFEMISQT